MSNSAKRTTQSAPVPEDIPDERSSDEDFSLDDRKDDLIGIDLKLRELAAEEFRRENRSIQLKSTIVAPNSAPVGNVIFKSASAFCAEYVPVAYIVEPMLRSASLFTLTAKTGSGKTAFLISTALAVVTGRADILNKEVHRGRVAYLVLENPDDFRVRLATAANRFNIDLAHYKDDLIILDVKHKPEEVVLKLNELARERPFSLIVIDTLPAYFDGKDINDAVGAGNFIRRLRPFTKISGLPAVLAASHPVKSADKDKLVPYGSGAIVNEVDGNLTLWREGATGYAKLHWQEKIRAMDFDPVVFRFEPVSHPEILDVKGREIVVPVIQPVSEQAAADREDIEEQLDYKVLTALHEQPGIIAADIARIIGRSTTGANKRLHKLKKLGLSELTLRRWHLTKKGLQYIEAAECINRADKTPTG